MKKCSGGRGGSIQMKLSREQKMLRKHKSEMLQNSELLTVFALDPHY